MNAGKAVVGVVWALCIASFVLPADSGAASIGRALFWGMLVVHVIECVAFRSALKSAPPPLSSHIVQTMIFGFFHLREIREAGAGSGESS